MGIIEGPVLPNFPGPFSLLLSFGGREHGRVYFGSSEPALFSTLKMVQIAHATRTLAFVSFRYIVGPASL